MSNNAIPPPTLGASIGTVDVGGTFTRASPTVAAIDNVVRCQSTLTQQTWIKLEYVDSDNNTIYQEGYLATNGWCFLAVDASSTSVSVYSGGTDSAGPTWGQSPLGSVTVTAAPMDASLGIDIWLDPSTQQPIASPAISLDSGVDVTSVPVNNRSGVALEVWVNGASKVSIGAPPTSPAPTVDLTTAHYQWSVAFEEGNDDPQIVIKRPPDQIIGRR